MTDSEAKLLMEQHGITAGHRAVYHYQGYVYGNLMDAVNYAELTTGRAEALAARQASHRPRRG